MQLEGTINGKMTIPLLDSITYRHRMVGVTILQLNGKKRVVVGSLWVHQQQNKKKWLNSAKYTVKTGRKNM